MTPRGTRGAASFPLPDAWLLTPPYYILCGRRMVAASTTAQDGTLLDCRRCDRCQITLWNRSVRI